MEKEIYDKQNGLWYELHGDYYLPCLCVPQAETYHTLGKYARAHLRYLQQHQPAVVAQMSAKGTLNRYLHDINTQAVEMLSRLTEQLAQQDGITEELKATDQMEWVRRMNGIRSQAEEIIMADIVYT